MKIIDKHEVEYVVPETLEERKQIEKIIADFENPNRKINLKDGQVIDNSGEEKGYWLRK